MGRNNKLNRRQFIADIKLLRQRQKELSERETSKPVKKKRQRRKKRQIVNIVKLQPENKTKRHLPTANYQQTQIMPVLPPIHQQAIHQPIYHQPIHQPIINQSQPFKIIPPVALMPPSPADIMPTTTAANANHGLAAANKLIAF